MKPEEKEELERRIADALRKGAQEEAKELGIFPTPLAIWDFRGVYDDDTPGQISQPDEVDSVRLKDDTVMCRSMYDELISTQVGDVRDAVVGVVAILWDGKPRHMATVLNTYDGFEGLDQMTVQEALGAIALALQSEFIFPAAFGAGVHALFSFEDTVALIEKQRELKYKHDTVELDKNLLPLTLLHTEFRIPIPELELATSYLMDVLERTGRTLLSFLSDIPS